MFLSSDAAGRWSGPRVALGLAVVASFGLAPGCFPTDNGPEPPQQQLYFPTALIPSTRGTALYVVNSDFDLQYKAGTVEALDLARIRTLVPKLWRVSATDLTREKACGTLGLQTQAASILYPGSCNPIDINTPPDGLGGTIVRNAVSIGAFASDATLALRNDAGKAGARLLIPVRGDPSLTWIDVDDESRGEPQTFRLECNQGAANGHCADDHKAGIDPAENTRSVTMPSEPFSISVSDDATAVIVSHQTTGTVSLFKNAWDTVRPSLTFVLGGLPTGVTGTLAFPRPKLAALYASDYPYRPGFLLSFRTAAEVDVVRYYDDAAASPSRPFLSRTQRIGISTNAIGFDSRSIAIDTRARVAAETACGEQPPPGKDDDYRSCLASAAGAPVAAFAANRIPPTLLVGQTTTSASTYGTDDSVYFYDSVPLSQGPSRVYVSEVWDEVAGKRRTRVFIVCFDARTLYVYDPDARAMEAVIQTGRGPSALAFDPLLGTTLGGADADVNPNYAYVAHFTDSYIGVLDLNMAHTTYLTIVATVGVPAAPRESK